MTVNEGNTLRPRTLALDSTGNARDDFPLTYTSLDATTASVDSTGQIEGKQSGFSTLTITAGGLASAATITVVAVESAGEGGFATGIARDLAGRLYLASAETHTVLRAEGLANAPEVYAGISQQPGLTNDVRLQSQFQSPSFLSVDQARGTVYVSDAANHVIREVRSGPSGRVQTLAGAGSPGSSDGVSTEAGFNTPQGIVLDNRGHLWVADQSNHTIRRINLLNGEVETIAGLAGAAGFADGQGASARFSAPTGIALEAETTAQQLARELSGAAPPPVRVIVADTENGALRRVTETGSVETLGSATSSSLSAGATGSVSPIELSDAFDFTSPTGVAVDAFGNIFVTEADAARVRTILTSGEVVAAAQPGTFQSPRGLSITQSGKLLVAERDRAPREVRFGEPQITTISPQQINAEGGAAVTVKGRNFAPDSSVVVAGVTIAAQFVDSQTLSFVSPALPSGRVTVTVQGRGGLAQSSLLAEPVSLDQLPVGYITTIAGGSSFSGDGSAATSALLWRSYAIAFDSAGNLYVADPDDHRVRKIDRLTGIILTVAGTGLEGFSGDGGPAVSAELNKPWGLALDRRGNLLIADSSNNRIRMVDLSTGLISTVAGPGGSASGDGGPAVDARLSWPLGMLVDQNGDWIIADTGNHRIRKVDPETGIITTIAGTGTGGFSGDGGLATGANLNAPRAVGLDRDGNLLISDTDNLRVRKVDEFGVISTVLGNGERVSTFSVTNGVATEFGISEPVGLALSAEGDVFVAAAGIVRFGDGLVTTVLSGQSGVPTFAKGLAVNSSGDLFVSDAPAEGTGEFSSRILRIDSSTEVTEYAGGGLPLGDGQLAWAARLFSPSGITIAPDGSLLIADRSVSRIRKVDAGTGLISTNVGFGALNLTGSGFDDNVPATEFGIVFPEGVATDSDGNIYIADTGAGMIQKVDANSGILTTIVDVAGENFGSSQPVSVDLDADGNIYFADAITDKVTRVDTAGTSSVILDLSDNLAGEGPLGIAIDRIRNQLYVVDFGDSTIVQIDLSTLVATRVAGTEGLFGGFNGDGVPAVDALLAKPIDVTVDSDGNLFIADSFNNRIRRVDAATGIIQTIAGDGRSTYSGDNGVGTDASIHSPNGVAVDSFGNVYISDTKNDRIRVIRGPIP